MGLLDDIFGGGKLPEPEMKPGDGQKTARLVVHQGSNPHDDWGWGYTAQPEGIVKESPLSNGVTTQTGPDGATVEILEPEMIPGCRSWAFVGAAPGEVTLRFTEENHKNKKVRGVEIIELRVDGDLAMEVLRRGKVIKD